MCLQVQYEEQASECRLGLKEGRPFSGVKVDVGLNTHGNRQHSHIDNGCSMVRAHSPFH